MMQYVWFIYFLIKNLKSNNKVKALKQSNFTKELIDSNKTSEQTNIGSFFKVTNTICENKELLQNTILWNWK